MSHQLKPNRIPALTRIPQHIEALETAATDLIARLAPWLAPAPTAYLVYSQTSAHLAWPPSIALIAALVLETLGLAVTSTALTLYRYNVAKRKTDPPAPLALPIALILLYFIAAELLTVALDIAPKLAAGLATTLADWAPAIFPILSLAGVATLAIRTDHRRRLAAIQAAKTARSRNRSTNRSPARSTDRPPDPTSTSPTSPHTVQPNHDPATFDNLTLANRARRLNRDQALDALIVFLTDNPDASLRQAGQAVDRSKSWALNAIRDLETAGRLRRSNGNGIEVLP